MRTFRFAAACVLLSLSALSACDSAPTTPQRTTAPVTMPLHNTSVAPNDTTPTASSLFCGGGANGGGHKTDTTTVCAAQ